jgi:hypothetical protein
MACESGILMAALTVAIIMADVWFWRSSRVITHLFLGGIATTLLVALCQRGYEMVNWAFLALIVVFILVSKLNIFSQSDYTQSSVCGSCDSCGSYDSCDSCSVPVSSCPRVAPVQVPVQVPRCRPVSMSNYGVEDPTESTKRWYHMKTGL